MLFGNVLRWQTDYLGRQLPVLPARNGFPRKVKPLVRLGEREMAAYCVLRGIDYIVEECPMAAGNKHLGYKEALNAIEATLARLEARLLLRVPRAGLGRGSRPTPRRSRRPRRRASAAARRPPARCAPSAGWSTSPPRAPTAVPVDPRATAGEPSPSAAGEQVLLIDTKKRRYLVTLTEGGEFHSHSGLVAHDAVIGAEEGTAFRSTHGMHYTAFRPTLSDFVLKMPRGAQVIYPKDLGPILLLADIYPGARVLESGVGSGALSMAMLRAGADIVGYELREDFAARAARTWPRFLGDEVPDRYRVEHPRLLRGHRRDRPRPRRARPARSRGRW